ncbi:hypothetical protein QNH46_19435 [Paenibacillus woosongensis]|uniref:Uncharacterized protein n=1 Tax=Paenibacillus woosongensis TaxID=307580 RepID=A0AA95L1P8_9BACL|nr:hypothetical protein [Paenibacillus woosongensis]WHX48252.1 hypothetical protein QNH46_19435 [Paenibacillus woosongensis]GIP60051.1 hypothetical protein J15TS10_38650 [Paenibacillus woosongensis]
MPEHLEHLEHLEHGDNPKTEAADHEYKRYQVLREYRPENDIPGDDLLPHDTRITQALSEDDPHSSKQADDVRHSSDFPDVPDADEIAANSPVDPAAPDPNAVPGIDVLNGYDGDDGDE